MTADLSYDVARHVVGTHFTDLPDDVVATARTFLLDAIGVAFAGTRAPGARDVADLTIGWGGRPDSTIIGFGGMAPAPEAAFVNGILVHACDFDDTHDEAVVHTNASVLPSALAVAQERGGVSGRDLITAFVLGVDLTCRLGLALRHYRGWHYSAVCGGFGAAAAAGKLLGLDEAGMVNALGIAYAQAAGNLQCVRDGALSKRLQLGFAAKGGVLAAYLARSGITGSVNTFDGQFGFLGLYDSADGADANAVRQGSALGYGRHRLVDGLGERFEIENLSMKPYPNSRAVHPAITGVLGLREEFGITSDQVTRIELEVSARTLDRVGGGEPPASQVAAQFSLAYGVSVATRDGDVTLADFPDKPVEDPELLRLMRVVTIVVRPDFHENVPVRVTVHLRDGRTFTRLVEHLEGSPADPMSKARRHAKFRQCCRWAAKPVPDGRIDALIDTVGRLDEVADLRELSGLLG